MSKRIKVLAYCDSPSVSTGFATVSKNILMGLHNTGLYDITVLGVNYWGIPHSFPFPIFPVGFNEQKDPYGRQKVCGMIMNMEFDILFFLQDTFILDFLPELHTALRSKGKKFKSIVYYPIDSPSKKEWIDNVKVCDYVVAYSQYGKDITVGFDPSLKDISVIPHGVNFNDFHPVNKQEVDNFRRQYFGPVADKWIVTNVSRNQQRKDIPRCISAFKEFKKQVPNSVLYIHAAFRDQGGDLKEVVDAFGLSTSKDVIFPERFSPNQGYPIHVLNMIYNASDCIVSTHAGEGFGFQWIEGMAVKKPVIMPSNTVMPEFIDSNNGWLYKSGGTPNLYHVFTNDNEVIRPLADIDDLVKTMVEVYNNKAEVDRRVESAYSWVRSSMSWQEHIVPMWLKIFKAASKQEESVAVVDDVKNKIIEAERF